MRVLNILTIVTLLCAAASPVSASIIDIHYTGRYTGLQTSCGIDGSCSTSSLSGQFALTLDFSTSDYNSVVTETPTGVTLTEPFAANGLFYTDGVLAFNLNSFVSASDFAQDGETDQHMAGITISKSASHTPTVDIRVVSALIPASITTPFSIDSDLSGGGIIQGPHYIGNFSSEGATYNLSPETLSVTVDGVGAVPELSTWILAILGFLSVSLLKRRKGTWMIGSILLVVVRDRFVGSHVGMNDYGPAPYDLYLPKLSDANE